MLKNKTYFDVLTCLQKALDTARLLPECSSDDFAKLRSLFDEAFDIVYTASKSNNHD